MISAAQLKKSNFELNLHKIENGVYVKQPQQKITRFLYQMVADN